MARILVIEDNQANMKLAKLLLGNVGHTVLCAGDAESGLIIARADQPNLILMDIQLPGMDGLAATAILKKDPATANIPVIALTAMAMKDDQKKTMVAGCDAYIAKPLRYQEFYRVIDRLLLKSESPLSETVKNADLVEAISPLACDDSMKIPPCPTAIHRGQKILVAEDNVLNQKLILRQLALLGYVAEAFCNGRLAFESWQLQPYALLLTDLHMPDMNGYELTAAIRIAEKDQHRMPIVALTATAKSDEADQCLAAGMDAYLGKPLRIADLKKALENWLPDPAQNLPMDEVLEFGALSVLVVDPSVLASLVGNDPVIITEFQKDFQLSAAKIANELREACRAGNARRVSEQAHKLTASAHAVGAGRLGDLCAHMEAMGKSDTADSVKDLLPHFESELQAVTDYFHTLQSSGNNPGDQKCKSDNSHINILILDDESFMHKLLAHMLAGLGYHSVRACENGADAVKMLDAGSNVPNLILLDLNMPGMDGIEFIRKLVECRYTGSLILVSGEDERILQMAEKLVQSHRITILGHLKKPVTLPGLAATVGKWQPAKTLHAIGKTYLAEELKAAIENDLLLNYYQPKVSLLTGELVGVETLVRWQHPKDGRVLPDSFIGLAEDNGLIDQLTQGVVIRAMEQARRWQQEGLKLCVAINLSMDNLMSSSFVDFFAETAGAAGVMPQTLMLEVTESRLMTDHRIPLEVLARLRIKRFGLSIDDFGTGHSSLTQLHDIPFNELKIDRSFVHGAWQDETLLAMYNASLGLGQQLGMVVVAEGVEDRADWEFLRRTGCDLAQGYFIGYPMPADELPIWLAAWNTRLKEFNYETT